MKGFTMGVLGIFLSATVAFAENCTEQFSWLPNTEADNAGYKIHYSLTSGGPYTGSVDVGNPSPVNGRIVATVPGLTCDKTYYFVTTSYNIAGLESDYSNQVKLLVAKPDSTGGNEPFPIITNIASN